MRRKEKEIKDPTQIEAIIERAKVCRLAMCDGMQPYVVPLCFGYKDRILYFHSALAGRKVDILQRNPQVCFEIDTDWRLETAKMACKWGMHFRSVIGFGRAEVVSSEIEKKAALDIIMAHYGEKEPHYTPETLKATLVIRIFIETMTGKQG